MKVMDMVDRILLLCNDRGISVNRLLNDLGVNHSLIHMMRSKGTIPSGEVFLKMSVYFHVPLNFLFCQDPFEPWEFDLIQQRDMFYSYLYLPKSLAITMGWRKEDIEDASLSDYINFINQTVDSIRLDDGDGGIIVTLRGWLEQIKADEQKKKPATVPGNELSDAEHQLIQFFRLVPPEKQAQVLGIIRQNLELAGLLGSQS